MPWPDDEHQRIRVRQRYTGLAMLDGAIACVLARHVVHAFVSAPSWLMFAASLVISLALLSSRQGVVLAWFAVGVFFGFGLPSAVPAPNSMVVTHAPALSHGVDLFDALERLDDDPQSLAGRRIAVTGLWRPSVDHASAAVFRRVMACCAADSIDVGFDVVPARAVSLGADIPVQVTGLVESVVRDGEIRYRLRDSSVRVMAPMRE